jgi:hypothetical protein
MDAIQVLAKQSLAVCRVRWSDSQSFPRTCRRARWPGQSDRDGSSLR